MRAFVTGGGRGIGAGIARALAGDGWDVVVGARSREQVEAVAEEIGGRWVQVDVVDRRSVEDAVAEAQLVADDWRESYNNLHPHSALGMLALSVFAERWRAADDCEPAVT